MRLPGSGSVCREAQSALRIESSVADSREGERISMRTDLEVLKRRRQTDSRERLVARQQCERPCETMSQAVHRQFTGSVQDHVTGSSQTVSQAVHRQCARPCDRQLTGSVQDHVTGSVTGSWLPLAREEL